MSKTHTIALGALVVFNASAHAATLYTPPLYSIDTDKLNCSAVNVSKRILNLEVSIHSNKAIDQQPKLFSLQPGEMTEMHAPGGISLYCKFRVINGSARDIRGLGSIYTTDGSDKVTIPAN